MDTTPVTQGLVHLPSGSERITDADEEVFLLYTNSQKSSTTSQGFRGLGHVDSRKDTLLIQFELTTPHLQPAGKSSTGRSAKQTHVKRGVSDKTVEVQVIQDKTALRTRPGDTGSVVWMASVEFARIILQQHHSREPSPLLNPVMLAESHILELGAGTGLLGIALSPLVRQYTITDIAALLPLIRKNLALNFDGWPSKSNVSVEELDWETLRSSTPALRSANFSYSPIDLILAIDCIYHPSLLPSLVETIDFLATPGKTAVMVVVELRAEDVVREFLETWIEKGWQVWRVSSLLCMPYVGWVGWKV